MTLFGCCPRGDTTNEYTTFGLYASGHVVEHYPSSSYLEEVGEVPRVRNNSEQINATESHFVFPSEILDVSTCCNISERTEAFQNV